MGYGFIRAHFNGRVIVPDEPVDWPVNQPLSIQAVPMTDAVADRTNLNGAGTDAVNGAKPTPEMIAERVERLRALSGRLASGGIPNEALRREHLYEDRG